MQGGHSSHRQTEHLSDITDSHSSDDSSLDSDDVADYLANVEPHSADSTSAEEQVSSMFGTTARFLCAMHATHVNMLAL